VPLREAASPETNRPLVGVCGEDARAMPSAAPVQQGYSVSGSAQRSGSGDARIIPSAETPVEPAPR
jgi:hypothetical protein